MKFLTMLLVVCTQNTLGVRYCTTKKYIVQGIHKWNEAQKGFSSIKRTCFIDMKEGFDPTEISFMKYSLDPGSSKVV